MSAAEVTTPEEGGLPDELSEDLAAAALALARRLHAGGTLWCASPAWPHHAHHVAVEFVHPVVVGKPALPAVALGPSDTVAVARANVRSGDVLVTIGAADDVVTHDLVRRSPAWGLTTVWVGAGRRPEPGAADHVLWLDDEAAAHDGRFTLLYHLLWELAHVCLEHGGLPALAAEAEEGPVCTTCADEGRLAEVVAVDGRTARVRTADGAEDVDLSLVGSVLPDDLLIVHAGMAITVLGGS